MSIVWNYQHGTLTVKAFYTGSAFVLSDPIITVTVSSLMGFMISVTTSNMWSPLEKALNRDDRDALSDRLLHLFLRVLGSSLKWDLVYGLCTHLKMQYAPRMKKKKWQTLLDLFMIRADIAFTLEAPKAQMADSVAVCGEALEALGLFSDAAALYQDVADSYAVVMKDKVKEQANCALA